MKMLPVGAEFFHAGGQTDRHDAANSRFSQFRERTKKSLFPAGNETAIPRRLSR
jgi:hypothetical protein